MKVSKTKLGFIGVGPSTNARNLDWAWT